MKKQKNLLKNSFSLFEVILSVSILSILISGFVFSTYYDTNKEKLFMLLNTLENDFNTKDYSKMTKTTHNLQMLIDNKVKYVNVKRYTFKNKDIELFKYE